MWKTITTIILGRRARAEEALRQENAVLIIEQKIREAAAGHDAAKRRLASLIARIKAGERSLAALDGRIADLERRAMGALTAGKQALAEDAARVLADLENERSARHAALAASEEKAGRLRLAVEKTERRLIDLRQGLMVAKSVEDERRALRTGAIERSPEGAMREAEETLQSLIGGVDPVEELEALGQIEAELNGDATIDALAAAGFGPARKVRPEDVLNRLKADAEAPAA